MGSRELKESCVYCFVTVDQVCLTEQLVSADWSAVEDRSAVELFCCGCIVERLMEVGLLVSLASPGNGGGVRDLRADCGRLREREE